MNVFIGQIARKIYIVSVLLILIPITALCKSDFKVAYQVDDQVISNYDIDQAKKLHNLMIGSSNTRAEIEKIVINRKIKELYGNRLQITVSEAELNSQLNGFLQSNKMKMGSLKSLLNSKGIHIETFYSFLRENIRWQKVLDNRFGYKINNLIIKGAIPLAPTPQKIEKEYEFSEIFISYNRWDAEQAKLIASRLEVELKAGANFENAVGKFSSAKSRVNKGKVGPVKKSALPEEFINALDQLKKNEVSNSFEIDGGLVLLKLERTRSYRTAKKPKLMVTFTISSASTNTDTVCSEKKKIKGPILLSKVEKAIGDTLVKLMPGESYMSLDSNGLTRIVTLCESFIAENKNAGLTFESIKKNEEALRLSNALVLELRRNTTVVKK
ncbi:peptidylprolyl isomerase [Paracoccaceae bacterium]|nr:peptidylprolyl isomerase [Paracoccaceae bacterium]